MIIFHYINSRVKFRELLLYCVMSDQSFVCQEGSFIVPLPEHSPDVFPRLRQQGPPGQLLLK